LEPKKEAKKVLRGFAAFSFNNKNNRHLCDGYFCYYFSKMESHV